VIARARDIAALVAAAALASCAHLARSSGGAWVATWEAPPQLTEDRNMPPAPLAGATIRQVAHVTLGGSRWRVRLSNEFGDVPIVVSLGTIARSNGADRIDEGSIAKLTFHGDTTVSISPGSAVWSDELSEMVPALSEVAITLFMSAVPARLTGHPGSRTTSFIMAGNHVRRADLPSAARTEHWYVISGLDVAASSDAAAVVVLGNSIADGRGSATDKNDRWPDNLARRLQRDARTQLVGVLNAGIGGNAVLRGGLGPNALDRFDRDVLNQRGVRWLIVSEGVNDLGGSRPDSAMSTADQLIDAYKRFIERAHARGVRVYGATMLPFGGSSYGAPQREAARARINEWVRRGGAFDAVIDFDAALRDPATPSRLRGDADSGDHLHPNENGYRLMADAIDLALFRNTHQ
jgi:lysophospholipase L1-like esterase